MCRYTYTHREKDTLILRNKSHDVQPTVCLHLHHTLLLVIEALLQVTLLSKQDNGSLAVVSQDCSFILEVIHYWNPLTFPRFFVVKTAFCVVTTKKMGLHLPGPTLNRRICYRSSGKPIILLGLKSTLLQLNHEKDVPCKKGNLGRPASTAEVLNLPSAVIP